MKNREIIRLVVCTALLAFIIATGVTQQAPAQIQSLSSLQALQSGTNGLPSIAFGNSPNTGIYSSAFGTLDFSIQGNSVYRWNLSGYTIGGTLYLYTGTRAFAGLSAEVNGAMIYCSDCTIANPCAGAGTGAMAKRLNAVWVCN